MAVSASACAAAGLGCACTAEEASGEGSVGFAFAMTIGAGMCTTIGGALSYLGKIEDKRILAASLAVSAGVMIYVSFVEIFVKGLGGFTDQFVLDGQPQEDAERNAYFANTGFFFVGMLLTWLIKLILDRMRSHPTPSGAPAAGTGHGDVYKPTTSSPAVSSPYLAAPQPGRAPRLADGATLMAAFDKDKDNSLSMVELQAMVASLNGALEGGGGSADGGSKKLESVSAPEEGVPMVHAAEAAALQQMGLFTALSIFIHNFPEGLATFIATLADPAAGAALAVAIGMHNIPEGICVGFPIYYATGSRWKAFWASFFSGISEPIGGFVGWLLMKAISGGGDISPLAYGIMFGIVAGMMVYIVVAQLLPAAHRYDPNDQLTTLCTVGGMVAMAASLVVFQA